MCCEPEKQCAGYDLDVFYPNCNYLRGVSASYLTPECIESKPRFSSCRECHRYYKCQQQYARYHKPVKNKPKDDPETTIPTGLPSKYQWTTTGNGRNQLIRIQQRKDGLNGY